MRSRGQKVYYITLIQDRILIYVYIILVSGNSALVHWVAPCIVYMFEFSPWHLENNARKDLARALSVFRRCQLTPFVNNSSSYKMEVVFFFNFYELIKQKLVFVSTHVLR